MPRAQSSGTRIIDTTQTPFVPEGWLVASHRSQGVLEWNRAYHPAELIQLDIQRTVPVQGSLILRSFSHRRFLNATLLRYFIEDPGLYPDDWKSDNDNRPIFVTYLGTEFYRVKDEPWILSSYWDEDTKTVGWDLVSLAHKYYGKRTYAAVLKQLSRERAGAIG